jgi:hypothetical protein
MSIAQHVASFAEVGTKAASFFFHGPSRLVISLVAHSFAKALDPGFVWVEIVGPSTGVPAAVAAEVPQWDDAQRHLVLRADRVRPEHEIPPASLNTLVHPRESPEAMGHLADFVRFPEVLQEIIAGGRDSGRPRVVYLSNTDFTEPSFSAERGAFVPFLRAAKAENVSIVCARIEGVRPNRFDFDYVFHLEDPRSGTYGAAQIAVEQGGMGSPFPTGSRFPVGEIPGVAKVLESL